MVFPLFSKSSVSRSIDDELRRFNDRLFYPWIRVIYLERNGKKVIVLKYSLDYLRNPNEEKQPRLTIKYKTEFSSKYLIKNIHSTP